MDGIINVLKPPGLTSRQVVSIVKGITKEKKVGHAGTLDPGACGVLPVMVGKATRLFDYIGEGKKEYIAEFTFGTKTTTQDSYGVSVDACDKKISLEQVKTAIQYFIGECTQKPSIFSAVHINGKRAYDYAFDGVDVDMPERKVTVYEAQVLHQICANTFLVRIMCSKGCYIRSLCEDVAHKLGTFAYVSVLIRTKTGIFNIEDSVTLNELEENPKAGIVSMESVVAGKPDLHTNEDMDVFLHNGNKLPLDCFDKPIENDTLYRVYDSKNTLWALGQQDGDILRIKLMLKERQ